jgi:hypothetical protein
MRTKTFGTDKDLAVEYLKKALREFLIVTIFYHEMYGWTVEIK